MRWFLLAFLAGCGGASYEPPAAATAPERPPATAVASVPKPPAPKAPVDPAQLAIASIACFSGGVWDELAAAADRCGWIASDVLGDTYALSAVRGVDPHAVDAIVEAMGAADAQMIAVVRAAAGASREALLARHAAARNRKAGAQLDESDAAALSSHAALEKLWALPSPTGRVVALVLAADHLELVRGLSPTAKLAAATPAFSMLFGVPAPTKSAPGSWLAYVSEAAKAAGHPVEAKGSTHEREQAAFVAVAQGLAEKFEAIAAVARGEPKVVATTYAKRLREGIAERIEKAKTKADAKSKADAAEKKSAKP